MRTVDESLAIIRSFGMPESLITAMGQGDRAKLDEWATGLIDDECESMLDDSDEVDLND